MNNTELVQSYRQQIGNMVNQANLQLFWNMYNRCGQHGLGLAASGPSAPSGGPLGAASLGGGGQVTHSPKSADEQVVEPPRGVTPSEGQVGS